LAQTLKGVFKSTYSKVFATMTKACIHIAIAHIKFQKHVEIDAFIKPSKSPCKNLSFYGAEEKTFQKN